MRSKILKNSSYLIIAQVITKVIAFFYTIFIAKSLGVEQFGLFIVALSYFSLFASITDFGIARFLIREIAKDEKNIGQLLYNTLILRLTGLLLLLILFSVFLFLFDPDKLRATLVFFAIIAVIPHAAALTLDSVFIALQKFPISGIGIVVVSLANALLGTILLKNNFGTIGVVFALIFAQLIYLLTLVLFSGKYNISLLSSISIKTIKNIMIGSLPYGLLTILAMLYFKIDTIMLSYLKGSYDAGIYGASYKFLEAIIFIPASVSAAAFPLLAKLHKEDKKRIKAFYFKALKLLTLLSIPITITYIIGIPLIIEFLLPSYKESIIVIQILSLTIPFMFAHAPATIVLLSSDKLLKSVLVFSLVTLLFNVLINFALIPKFGYIGSSIATVLSEILSFIVFFSLLRKKLF